MSRNSTDPTGNRSGVSDAPERYPLDRQLAVRAATGDATSIRALGVRLACVPKLLRAANQRRSAPLSPNEMDDVIQDTLLQLWRKIGSYSGTASLETWAWSFGAIEMKSRTRRNSLRRSVEGTHLDALKQEPAMQTHEEPRFPPEEVRAAIDRMPREVAEVICQKHDRGRKFREIAASLSISENTEKTRYYRGIGLLRDQLARESAHRPIR